jgi:hypothetical protein
MRHHHRNPDKLSEVAKSKSSTRSTSPGAMAGHTSPVRTATTRTEIRHGALTNLQAVQSARVALTRFSTF